MKVSSSPKEKQNLWIQKKSLILNDVSCIEKVYKISDLLQNFIGKRDVGYLTNCILWNSILNTSQFLRYEKTFCRCIFESKILNWRCSLLSVYIECIKCSTLFLFTPYSYPFEMISPQLWTLKPHRFKLFQSSLMTELI